MDGTEEHHLERGQPGSEDQKLYVLPYIWTLDAAVWLDLDHMIRGEHTREIWE
jgi:hypothetical protein